MRIFRMAIAIAAVSLTASVSAYAQTPLADLLPDLILREIILPPAGAPGNPHVAHFSPLDSRYGTDPTGAIATVTNFNRAFRQQFATLPLGSSSGGFTYTYDASLGTFTRRTTSFGPSFTERATTIGKGRLSVGANYQHSNYDTLEGENLEHGNIRFYLPHNDCCPGQTTGGQAAGDGTLLNPAFEGDVLEASLRLRAKTDTVGLFASYGVTNRWDVGVALPIVRAELDATVVATIIRLATPNNPLIHTFVEGSDVSQATFARASTASGVGDIVLRTKYSLAGGPVRGVSAALDLRLPTGDTANLLGTGAAQAKFFLVASSGSERFAQHFNVGYTLSGTGSDADAAPVDEFNYAAGFEIVPMPRLTIIGDVLGRTLRDSGRLELQARTFQYQIQGQPIVNPPRSVEFSEFQLAPGNLNLLLGAGGFKFGIGNNLLVSANVLFPLTYNGLRDRFTTVVGLDYAF